MTITATTTDTTITAAGHDGPATAPAAGSTIPHWTGVDPGGRWLIAARELVPVLAERAEQHDADGTFVHDGFDLLREQLPGRRDEVDTLGSDRSRNDLHRFVATELADPDRMQARIPGRKQGGLPATQSVEAERLMMPPGRIEQDVDQSVDGAGWLG